MPIISMFYGIIIYMYFYDTKRHHKPHFHVEYAEHTAIISIDGGEILEGSLPPNKMKLVAAWVEIHHEDLMADWKLAVNGQPAVSIKPLE
jgi:Domain of unknown function (DUF4160)